MSLPIVIVLCVTALGLAVIWAAVKTSQQKEK